MLYLTIPVVRASPLIVCLFSVKVELEATSNLLEVQFFVASTVTATYLMALSIFELVVIVHVDALLLFPNAFSTGHQVAPVCEI